MPARARASKTAPPHGRAAVMDAVCKAGAELFARRGPAGASSREIADRAGVNYGLIHRHFGSREQLVSAVMTRLSADLGAALEQAGGSGCSVLETLAEHPDYVRALGRAALDGVEMTTLQDSHPILEGMLDVLSGGTGGETARPEQRAEVAVGVAAILGWAVFGSFLGPALGLESSEASAAIEAAFPRLAPPH